MPDHHGFQRKRFQPRDIALLWSKAGEFCSHPECPLHLPAEDQATNPAQTQGLNTPVIALGRSCLGQRTS